MFFHLNNYRKVFFNFFTILFVRIPHIWCMAGKVLLLFAGNFFILKTGQADKATPPKSSFTPKTRSGALLSFSTKSVGVVFVKSLKSLTRCW